MLFSWAIPALPSDLSGTTFSQPLPTLTAFPARLSPISRPSAKVFMLLALNLIGALVLLSVVSDSSLLIPRDLCISPLFEYRTGFGVGFAYIIVCLPEASVVPT